MDHLKKHNRVPLCCTLVIQLRIPHQQGDRFCLCLCKQYTGALKRMPDQHLLPSVLAPHFHAGSSQCTSPSGIALGIVPGTCRYGAERGPWCRVQQVLLPRPWSLPGVDPGTEGDNPIWGRSRQIRAAGHCSLDCSLSDLSKFPCRWM